jgi:hypothetical protein
MGDWRDDVRRDYEDLKNRFRKVSFEDFKKGDWFADLVRWVLESYAKQVDSDYIRRKYPGIGPSNQAKKAISLAAKSNGIAGGAAAVVISGAEVATIGGKGFPAPVTIPVIATAIMADVAYTTRTQLRTAYDLSFIDFCINNAIIVAVPTVQQGGQPPCVHEAQQRCWKHADG